MRYIKTSLQGREAKRSRRNYPFGQVWEKVWIAEGHEEWVGFGTASLTLKIAVQDGISWHSFSYLRSGGRIYVGVCMYMIMYVGGCGLYLKSTLLCSTTRGAGTKHRTLLHQRPTFCVPCTFTPQRPVLVPVPWPVTHSA